jgi:hypothetical protein
MSGPNGKPLVARGISIGSNVSKRDYVQLQRSADCLAAISNTKFPVDMTQVGFDSWNR